MSAKPVNGLSQFVVAYTKTEFEPGKPGFNAMGKFLNEVSTLDIARLAQGMLSMHSGSPIGNSVSLLEDLISRVERFDKGINRTKSSIPPEQRAAVHDKALTTIGLLQGKVRVLQEANAGRFSPLSRSAPIDYMEEESNDPTVKFEGILKTLFDPKSSKTSKERAFEGLSTLLISLTSRQDMKTAKALVVGYLNKNPDQTTALRSLVLHQYNYHLVNKERETGDLTDFGIRSWMTHVAVLTEKFETDAPDRMMGDFEVVPQTEVKDIFQNGPDAIARVRRTAGLRSALKLSPYELGGNYRMLRNVLRDSTPEELKDLILGEDSGVPQEQQEAVFQRFYDAFIATENIKTKRTSEIDEINDIKAKALFVIDLLKISKLENNGIARVNPSDLFVSWTKEYGQVRKMDQTDFTMKMYIINPELKSLNDNNKRPFKQFEKKYYDVIGQAKGKNFDTPSMRLLSVFTSSRTDVKYPISLREVLGVLDDKAFVAGLKKAKAEGNLSVDDVNRRIIAKVVQNQFSVEKNDNGEDTSDDEGGYEQLISLAEPGYDEVVNNARENARRSRPRKDRRDSI